MKAARTKAKATPARSTTRTTKPRAAQGKVAGVKARYDAAGQGRRMAGWNPPTSGPNTALQGLERIRARARDAVRNDWSGASSAQKWATTLIGVGITPRFKRIKDEARRAEIKDLYDDFVRTVDADGVCTFYAQQTLCVRGVFDGGEVFVRRRRRPLDPRFPVPLQVQLIEADQVPRLDADMWPGLPRGNSIREGIERNVYGERTAIWMYRVHPGDKAPNMAALDPLALVRVPIEDVSHIFEPTRIGQMRGVPEAAAVLNRLRTTNNYEDAVLERQLLSNLFALFITKAAVSDNGANDIDPLTGLPVEKDHDGAPLVKLEPGISYELNPGEDVKFANPPEAGTMYSDYMRTTNMLTAAGVGLPYELFSGDIKEISDRTLRVIINEFRRYAEQRQWQTFIPKFCETVIRWFAEAAVVAGKITIEEADAVRRAEWAPHGWQHIHPVQDPQGKILEIDAGLRSRSSVIGERGDDPDAVDTERKLDKERAEKLGLNELPEADKGKDGADPDEDGISSGEYSQPKKGTNALFDAQARLTDALVAVVGREPAPAAAPVVNITNNIPQTQVSNSVNVEPTPVTIENNVEPTPVTIENNVEPTPVHVEANVAAPNVVVESNPTIVAQAGEVSVKLPARKTETTVEYDAKDRIKKSTQLETDAD